MRDTSVTRRLAVLAAAALISLPLLAQQHGAGAASISWTVKKTGKPLEREATLVVSDRAGKPLTAAEIEVSLDMPSMPGAHRIAAVRALPTSTPGVYAARFQLEMAGEWTARIEMKSPERLKMFRKFRAE